MLFPTRFRLLAIPFVLYTGAAAVGRPELNESTTLSAMKRASAFMVDKVAVHGGYVWSYLPDLSRRWGEIEARPRMVWVQSPGTIQMGHVFLDAYHATGDEFYYDAAAQAAGALMAGQLPCGGWNYLIDFAGEQDLKDWYATVGRHAWRLEEFQHYYGNATFDDSSSSDACRYLLRFYLEKRDATAKAALDRAIDFVLRAQYPNGGWPQRFPRTDEFHHDGLPDYTGYITFNDDVTGGNVDLLIECYQALGDTRLLDPIRRGMDVFLATQGPASQPAWSLQHSTDLKPAGARTYEPPSYATHTTAANIRYLLKFYRLTGDPKYLARIPEALAWLDAVRLPPEVSAPRGATHPTFVEIGTNRPLYIHRQGSNAENGRYYADHDWHNTIVHYSSFRYIDVAGLRAEFEATKALAPDVATKDSPLRHPLRATPFPQIFTHFDAVPPWASAGNGADANGSLTQRAARVVAALDDQGRWITNLRMTSHPFPAGPRTTPDRADYSRTEVGDHSDTSPYPADHPLPGISTAVFVRNMDTLIAYLGAKR
jgi:PelA/Pel-15E family pectate lyase